MSSTFVDLLINCQKDLNKLTYVKKYIADASKHKKGLTLSWPILQAVKSIISISISLEKPSSQQFEIILDIVRYLIQTDNDEVSWSNFGFELGNLILKILIGIERMENFQSFFCHLLSSINIACKNNLNVWRLVMRPLLNIFINKKFKFVYLESALREFKKISKCANPTEVVNFTKNNLHLIRGFSMIPLRVGDFAIQMDIVDLVFLFIDRERSLAKGFFSSGNSDISELIEKMDFTYFEQDTRLLLNALNRSLRYEKKVFSVCCNTVCFGKTVLEAPAGMEGIWVDINRDSKRLTITCTDFLSNDKYSRSTLILKVPLNKLENLEFDSSEITGAESYCITLNIRDLIEMFEFAKENIVILTTPNSRDYQNEVMNFLKIMNELSDNCHQGTTRKKLNPSKNNTVSGSVKPDTVNTQSLMPYSYKNRVSCTSPLIFFTGTSNNNSYESENSQTLQKSPSAFNIRSVRKMTIAEKASPMSIRKTQTSDTGYEKISSKIMCPWNMQSNDISRSTSKPQKSFRSSQLSSDYSPKSLIDISPSDPMQHIDIPKGKMNAENVTLRIDNEMEEATYEFGKLPRFSPRSIVGRDSVNLPRNTSDEWTNTDEDSILTQEFLMPNEANKENITVPSVMRATFKEDKVIKNSKKTDWLSQNKKVKAKKTDQTEITCKASLLDPDGYSFKRWKMPTTSERSNFWLNKLKSPRKNSSDSKINVFNFSEDEYSDESGKYFVQKTKKSCVRNSKSRRGNRLPPPDPLNIERITLKKKTVSKEVIKCWRERKLETKKTDQLNEELRSDQIELNTMNEVELIKGTDMDNPTRDTSRRKNTLNEAGKQNRVTPGTKRKLSSWNKTMSVQSASDFDLEQELDTIIDMFSQRIGFLLQYKRAQDLKKTSEYMKFAESTINHMSREEENRIRLDRFDKWMEYFVEGCSQSELNRKDVRNLTNLQNGLKLLEKNSTEDMITDKFIKKLQHTITSKTNETINKFLKEQKIRLLESYLSKH